MLNRVLLFVTAAFLGSMLVKLHVPIPYMLGGIVTAVLCKLFGSRMQVSWPKKLRMAGLMVAGYGIGATCTSQALATFLDEFSGVIEANVIAIGVSVVLAIVIARLTKTDLQSCVMGMMPGGITLMMLLTEENKRTNPNVVMVMQVIRLLGVVISVPFLAILFLDAHLGDSYGAVNNGGYHWLLFIPLAVLGNFIAKKIHLPTPMFLGTIILTAVFAVTAGQLQPVPNVLMAAAQVSIGLYMGMLLDGERIAKTKNILPLTILGTVILVGVSVAVAFVLSERYGFSLITAFLAMAPGGIAEMALAGMSMGEDVTVILAYQLVRVLGINLLVPPALNWYFKNK